MLKIENLEVAYGNIKAIKGISLEVNEGEIVSLSLAGEQLHSLANVLMGQKDMTLLRRESLILQKAVESSLA